MTNDDIIKKVLEREGGFVDHPADRGGPTNRGITLVTLSRHLGRKATAQEIKDLDEATARDIYLKLYIWGPGYDDIIDSDLRYAVVDAAVNHGEVNATKMLQRAVGAYPDGVFGPKTKEKVNTIDVQKVKAQLVANRARFYGSLITNNQSQAVFAKGWMDRLAGFIESLG